MVRSEKGEQMRFRYRIALSLLAVACLFLGASTAVAQGPDNLNVRIALHNTGPYMPAKGSVCDPRPAGFDQQECTTYTTAGITNEQPGPNVYIVAGQGSETLGIKGVSFGIDYNGRETNPGVGINPLFVAYTNCTDGIPFLQTGPNGEFPAPGGSLRVTWQTCQNTVIGGSGVHALVGALYVYVYSADTLKVTPNMNLTQAPFSEFSVTDCMTITVDILPFVAPDLIDNLGGRIVFGGGDGFTPCGVVNTQPTTWGKIKDRYTAGE